MKYSFVIGILAVAALAEPIPQAVTAQIAPSSPPPAGCSTSAPGTFEITVEKIVSKRSIEERQTSGILTLKLSGGILTDQAGRTGYIASNRQFQFDSPPQAGAIYTAGFSLCSNGSLALGGSTTFWQCLADSYYDLYDQNPNGIDCSQVDIVAISSSGAVQGGGSGGQVTQKTDGQPEATTAAAVSEKSEGQPVATSAPPAVSEKSEGQPVATSAPPAVSEKSEGQPVATSAPPAVSEKSEGQPVATSAPPAVSEKSEGQPVATSAPPAVSEKSEGQPVASSSAPAVSEKSEGQPVATSAPAVSVKSEGQPVVTSSAVLATSTSASASQFTGAAATAVPQVGALAAGLLGLIALL